MEKLSAVFWPFLVPAQTRLARSEKECEIARSLNDALRANQADLQERLRGVEAGAAAAVGVRDAKIRDLEEQLRDMYVSLETQRVIEGGSARGEDLRSASVVAVRWSSHPAECGCAARTPKALALQESTQ